MTTSSPGPDRVRALPVVVNEPLPPLREAGADDRSEGIWAGPVEVDGIALVTGRRLIAAVTGVAGLREIRLGPRRVGGPVRVRAGAVLLAGSGTVALAPGRWERALANPGGLQLIERGLLLDETPALLLQWLPARGTGEVLTDGIELTVEANGEEAVLALDPGEEGVSSLLFVPPGTDADRALALARTARARALTRAGRGTHLSEGGLDLATAFGAGAPEPRIASALRALDDAFAGPADDLDAEEPILQGWTHEGPRFLDPTGVAEVGLALLAVGRRDLAWCALAAVAAAGTPPPGPLLLLAARWALWTGQAARLAAIDGPLEAAISRVVDSGETGRGGLPDPGAAFPSMARTLESLADAFEPLGTTDRVARLRSHAAALRRGPADRGRRLPVLGAPPPSEPPPRRDTPRLPPPEGFAPVDHAATLSRRTLHAARLVRSWVEGVLGVEPDAAYGRLAIGPDLGAAASTFRAGPAPPGPGPERETPGGFRVDVTGLAVGDARLSLSCRIEGTRHTFRLFQDSGRIPLNVVFAPRLPLARVDRVRLGDEDADVEIVEDADGLRVRCQFPLDPERRVTIDGAV